MSSHFTCTMFAPGVRVRLALQSSVPLAGWNGAEFNEYQTRATPTLSRAVPWSVISGEVNRAPAAGDWMITRGLIDSGGASFTVMSIGAEVAVAPTLSVTTAVKE